MANSFKNQTMRREYDGAVLAFSTRHRDLFTESGSKHVGSSFAAYFWAGYEGETRGIFDFSARESKAIIGYAYYRAGIDMKKREAKTATIETEDFEGRWKEPIAKPPASAAWHKPAKGGLQTHLFHDGGRPIAMIRTNPFRNEVIAEVPGWVWNSPAKGSTADTLKVKNPAVKGFPTLSMAKLAIRHALAMLH